MVIVLHCHIFLYGHSHKEIEKIIKTVTVSKISIKYALSKYHILDLALKGVKNPISEFEKKFNKSSYFKKCDKRNSKSKKKMKSSSHSKAVKKLGMAVAIQELLTVRSTLY